MRHAPAAGSNRRAKLGALGDSDKIGICHSYTPDGRCVSPLKILLTNYCIYDCQYCVNRITSDTPRARFAVNDVVNLTLEFYRRNYIEGLFLNSGVIQSATTRWSSSLPSRDRYARSRISTATST